MNQNPNLQAVSNTHALAEKLFVKEIIKKSYVFSDFNDAKQVAEIRELKERCLKVAKIFTDK